ncbi:unnamed protein product [Moneuplotes crassus]|uniref:MORN repeat protein n=1 Tax=Euplotes crassus TaxID=5936 RepID=A0AAD1XYB7_EUPCR|nr:unnamed protein product [Moneuplotes crassus]
METNSSIEASTKADTIYTFNDNEEDMNIEEVEVAMVDQEDPHVELEYRPLKTNDNGNTYDGQWNKITGLPHGKGTATCASGEEYEGDWKNDKRNGRGTETYPQETLMKENIRMIKNMEKESTLGLMEKCTRNGFGTMWWPNGTKYEGFWANDKPNGKGTFTWEDGRKFVGLWKNGKQHGRGVEYDVDGNKTIQNWENGELL